MSDNNIMDTIEELPTGDKKKAINLQDLLYVKKYIDDNLKPYRTEMDERYEEFQKNADAQYEEFTKNAEAQYEKFTTDLTNLAETTAQEVASSTTNEILGNILENDGTAVANANKVQGVDLSDDTVSKFGEYVISKKKLLWNGAIDLEVASNRKQLQAYPSAVFLSLLYPDKTYEIVGYTEDLIAGTFSYIKRFKCRFDTYGMMPETDPDGTGRTVAGGSSSDMFFIDSVRTNTGNPAMFALSIGRNTTPSTGTTSGRIILELGTRATDELSTSADNLEAIKITHLYEVIE